MPGPLIYRTNHPISIDQYITLLIASTLGERRPVDDRDRIASMLHHANILITAWDGDHLVGASRCLSDFAHSTYCADLCVHRDYQRRGIGRRLLQETLRVGGCRIVLLSAPAAVDYYPRIGMERHPSAWITRPEGLP